MKKLSLFVLILLIGQMCFIGNSMTRTCDNNVSQVFKNVYIEMPGFREIQGGSKIVVNYDSSVPMELQGAFEYAVKLWEEVLPMTLPIKIDVKVDNLRGSSDLLSRVTFDTDEYYGERVNKYLCPLSMVKSVLLQEYHSSQQNRFYDEIDDISILDGTDMTITYNKNKLNMMDFSLDGELGIAKYDFVTVALRDIAIGLGFTTNITANTSTKMINITGEKCTPFESLIMNAIGTNPSSAYSIATSGSLDIALLDWGGITIDTLSVYAPTKWVQGESLRYFIPDENPITRLLTHDFGTGYVMRDLSGVDWDDIFCGALDWRRDLATGSASGSVAQIGTTEDNLPYTGKVTIGFNNRDNMTLSLKEESSRQKSISSQLTYSSNSQSSRVNSIYSNTDDFCQRFNCFSPSGPGYNGLSLSVQKKDGTWEVLSYYYGGDQVTINIESLPLSQSEDNYARSTSGGLKYRLTKCTQNEDGLHGGIYYSYRVKYFTRDFTPQKANIKYSKIHNSVNSKQSSSKSVASSSYDDYFVDVEIGLSNIEGAKRVVVEQLDEGETMPFQYEIEDFRKGYFIANLDRELKTNLTVIAYNDNGQRRSNTITINPIGSLNNSIAIRYSGHMVEFDGLNEKLIESGRFKYSLTRLNELSVSEDIKTISSNSIDMSSALSGIYVLSLYKDSEKIRTFKFSKI